MKYENLTGRRFGKITVLSNADDCKNFKKAKWNCVCECGKICIRGSRTLLNPSISSCGCAVIEESWKSKRKKYGYYAKTSTPEYKTWCHIKARCYNQNHKKYRDYGGRGIKVCDRWLDSFETFLYDMGEKPTPDHSIERDNVDGNYEPSNCRWATWEEQCRNKRVVNKLGIPGVYWDKSRNNYKVTISIGGKGKTVGRYEELTDAVRSRKEAELKYWGKSS